MRQRTPKRAALFETEIYVGIVGRVGANVRRLREARGWTQEELAALAKDMGPAMLRQIEAGRTNITAATLARLCEALEVDAAELLVPSAPLAPRGPGRPARTVASARVPDAMPSAAAPDTPAEPIDRDPVMGTQSPAQAPLGVRSETEIPTYTARASTTSPPAPAPSATHARLRKSGSVREAVLEVLQRDPGGLRAGAIVEAVRAAGRKRLDADVVHLVLHGLCRRGLVTREGERGSFVYRPRPRDA